MVAGTVHGQGLSSLLCRWISACLFAFNLSQSKHSCRSLPAASMNPLLWHSLPVPFFILKFRGIYSILLFIVTVISCRRPAYPSLLHSLFFGVSTSLDHRIGDHPSRLYKPVTYTQPLLALFLPLTSLLLKVPNTQDVTSSTNMCQLRH